MTRSPRSTSKRSKALDGIDDVRSRLSFLKAFARQGTANGAR